MVMTPHFNANYNLFGSSHVVYYKIENSYKVIMNCLTGHNLL